LKAATVNDIKQEISQLTKKEVEALCQRLARFKKENKELLTYLLFEAGNEEGFVSSIKAEIDELFADLPKPNWYFTKKALSKILRLISRYSKYTAVKESHVQMLLHFCYNVKQMHTKNRALTEMYSKQVKKLHGLIALLHEDLRYDYERQLSQLEE